MKLHARTRGLVGQNFRARSGLLAALAIASQALMACSDGIEPNGAGASPSLVAQARFALTSSSTGTWTQVAAPFPTGDWPATATLLTDGRVLAAEHDKSWYALSPDPQGSYENGTWSALASSPVERLFHPGFVLRDGRYWTGGGEYRNPEASNPGENEIYDPVTDTWTVAPEMPQAIGDTPTALLADGRILVLSHASTQSYLLSSYGAPPSWSTAAPWSTIVGDTEASSLLLPDGSVLVGTRQFQRYLPQGNSWVSTALPPGGDGQFVAPNSDEMGPMVLLHDGRALVLGSNPHNGLYTPPGVSTDPGSWQLAADTPNNLNHGDAPSVVEPDGKVLTVVTDDLSGIGYAQAVFQEYDPSTDSWTLIPTPFTFGNAERVLLFCLPSGQIWASGLGSSNAWLYTPAGTAKPEWRPNVSPIVTPGFGEYIVRGTQLNGLTTGGDFGDDGKMATNFPVVSVVDTLGRVTYARSHDFDQMAPRPQTTGSFAFTLPKSVPNGTYAVRVSANGVAANRTPTIVLDGVRTLSLSVASTLTSGQPATMQLTLSGPAPSGGTVLKLTSSDPTVVTVPAGLTVPEGISSFAFDVTNLAYGTATISVAALKDATGPVSSLIGWTVAGLAGPVTPTGNTARWTVTLDHATAANGTGVPVSLQSSNPAAVAVPATVTVPPGASSATFDLTLLDATAAQSTITASLGNSARTGTFGYLILNHTISPSHFLEGTTAIGTVTLNGNAPTGGLVVTLQNNNPALALAAPSVTIPEGAATGSYAIDWLRPGNGSIVAALSLFGSHLNASYTTQLNDAARIVSSVTGPATPTGNTAQWTLTLDKSTAAKGTGVVVNLQSSNPAAVAVPATVTVPPGASSASFDLTLLDATAAQSTISASLRSSLVTAPFGYLIATHTISPSPFLEGTTATGTVTLNGNAPTGGLVVTLRNVGPVLALAPASVTVPEGAATGDYALTWLSPGNASILAALGPLGARRTASYWTVSK